MYDIITGALEEEHHIMFNMMYSNKKRFSNGENENLK